MDSSAETRQKVFKTLVSKQLPLGQNSTQNPNSATSEPSEASFTPSPSPLTPSLTHLPKSHLFSPSPLTFLTGWRLGSKAVSISTSEAPPEGIEGGSKAVNGLLPSPISEAMALLPSERQKEITYLASLGEKVTESENFVNFLKFSKLDR